MKVFAVSTDRNWIKLGNTFSDAQWYNTEKVKDLINEIQKGDEVEIKSSKNKAGKNVLEYIKKVEKNNSNNNQNNKALDKNEEIKRLSILRAVAEAIQALTGQVDINNIGDVMEQLYDRFYKKISEE